ncbi:MAG: NAD(P)-dependent oxidoreductase [Alphaproteobacteria bacterium]|nr:NAD(P)-dependent oxidoreductase [Alphaproteobacteria bacterium]MBU1525737.1 NAD(P)-dependent oxidoreductase [Alphaproteobacteria bacterium]MBU2351882.1 NAD(P)-dependent oxidoreductase [Alphaproteobacteria bacterium]MBU2382736.1 NAD(P)-dependent oxidoreductase [Alphaproteobacteria bacterium]
MKIGFVGLGVMGAPMAGHLVRAGHPVAGFNRSPGKTALWAENHGGRAAASVAEAADGAELLILCVGNDDDVRATVAAGLQATAAGAVIVDHTTTSAVVAREMATLAGGTGRGFLDAPVSGGQAGAEAGKLSVMVGGDAGALDRARPALEAYAKAIRHMGPAGAGQLTKMVNQICIAGVVQGLAEAVHFSQRAGLDPEAVLAAVSQGAAQSWQMDNRWSTMARGEFEFGFAVDWMRKDLGLVLDEARRNGSRLALTALVDQFYAEVQAMGGARWDTSSLAARLGRD